MLVLWGNIKIQLDKIAVKLVQMAGIPMPQEKQLVQLAQKGHIAKMGLKKLAKLENIHLQQLNQVVQLVLVEHMQIQTIPIATLAKQIIGAQVG